MRKKRKREVLTWRRRPRFHLGRVVVTPSVRTAHTGQEIRRFLKRHASGDWGSGYIGRGSPNERFLGYGFRLDSHYRRPGDHRPPHGDVLITTDPVALETGRRASTTVYLFSEYWEVHGLE